MLVNDDTSPVPIPQQDVPSYIRKNIIGQHFSSLTVQAFDRKDPHGNTYWQCLCICGKTTVASRSSLTTKGMKSCGCQQYNKDHLRRDVIGQRFGDIVIDKTWWAHGTGYASGQCACGAPWQGAVDQLTRKRQTCCKACSNKTRRKNLSGQRFGKLLALETWRENGRSITRALCNCGQIWEGLSHALLQGITTSCGCHRRATHRIDYTGQQFGLLAVQRMEWADGNGKAYCICACGNAWEGNAAALVTGNTTSCGCKRKQTLRHDLTGQQFERLTVLSMSWEKKGRPGSCGWALCACTCGQTIEVRASSLLTGAIRSCGCLWQEYNDSKKLTPEQKKYLDALVQQKRRERRNALPRSFTKIHKEFALKYWHFSCCICSREGDGFWHWIAMDHFIPIANPEYPGEVPSNMIPLCHFKKRVNGVVGCNNAKASSDPILWIHEYFTEKYGPKLGPRKAKAKLKEIQTFFIQAQQYAATHDVA